MSKAPQKIDRQLRLPFTAPEPERAGDYRHKEAVREALNIALKHCELSREEIAEEMSRITGDKITAHHLNNWVAECKKSDWRFPLEYAAALMVVTGDYGILQAALKWTGLKIITQEEGKLLEYGRIMVEEKLKKKKKQALLADLGVDK